MLMANMMAPVNLDCKIVFFLFMCSVLCHVLTGGLYTLLWEMVVLREQICLYHPKMKNLYYGKGFKETWEKKYVLHTHNDNV